MKAMVISYDVVDNLWGEYLLGACFLRNRILHKKIGKTSYEL